MRYEVTLVVVLFVANGARTFANEMQRPPKNCADVLNGGGTANGVYQIGIPMYNAPFYVYCDQSTDGGGWAVIQRRQDGSENFAREWADFKVGFGSLRGEYWLGLENIHRLSTVTRNELRVELEDFSGKTAFAKYSLFSIANEQGFYKLNVGTYSGTAGDSLTYHNGMKFSTKDQDNDPDPSHCGAVYGAWWHKTCHYANLNGPYHHTAKVSSVSVSWYHWLGDRYVALKKARMMIRPLLH